MKRNRFDIILESLLKKSVISEEDGSPLDRRPMYDDSEDVKEFGSSLDPESPDDVYYVEGLDPEVYSMVDKTTEQVVQWSDEVQAFVKRLVDPKNPEAILTKLTSVAKIPEFADAAEKVAKPLEKVFSELGRAQAALDTLATLAKSRRDKRKQQDASTGPSGPY